MRRFRVPALLAGLVLAALALWPAAASADIPPYAYQRLDRVGAALGKDPLFVDPDLSHALDGAARARVRSTVRETSRELGVPVYVVVIPNPSDSESQGRDNVFLFQLHERTGRDGLYLMVSGHGTIEHLGFMVPRRPERRYVFDDDLPNPARPADHRRPFDGLADRIGRVLGDYVSAPSASPRVPRRYSTPDPFGQEPTLKPAEPETSAPFLAGLLVAGPVAGAVLYWAGLVVLALRRPPATSRRAGHGRRPARTRPGRRWLRRHAAGELRNLRRLLAAGAEGPARAYAVAAYDAAQILFDDAEEDEERAIDLVGVIVLARQGRVALTRETASPPLPCGVNPLHGGSTTRRRVRGLDVPDPCPLCERCAEFQKQGVLGPRHLLKIPGPEGPRPHTAVPGVWRDTGWGARDKNILPRVMRYLGVD